MAEQNMSELRKIQQELKVPKSQKNKFGNYSYRSQEDILEAVKPLLKKFDCALLLSDEVVQLGDRFYVKATAKLFNSQGKKIEVSGFARESLDRKGMDSSMITGSASSYARKYALNGLFCIDDTKDADELCDSSKVVDKVSPGSFGGDVKVPNVCAGCSCVITDAEKDFSIRKFSKSLCRSCQDIVKADQSREG